VSIGINLFPLAKVCSFNCIYCFRGSTSILTAEPVDDGSEITSGLLVKALEVAVEEVAKGFGGVRAIDFSGRGEPTLHPRFREFLDTVKAFAKSRGLSTSIGCSQTPQLCTEKALQQLLRKLIMWRQSSMQCFTTSLQQ
jgi:wyosine [tRNA(Phe)-imidazoG37] synthetase (radical SAM superfamily)